MSTITTKARYSRGVLIPETAPPYDIAEAIVVYVPKLEDAHKTTANSLSHLKTVLRRTFGVWKNDAETGTEYVKKIRNESEESIASLWKK